MLSRILRTLNILKPEPATAPYVVCVVNDGTRAPFVAHRCHSEAEAREALRRTVQAYLNNGWQFVSATPISATVRWQTLFVEPFELTVGYEHVGVPMLTALRTAN